MNMMERSLHANHSIKWVKKNNVFAEIGFVKANILW